MNFKPKPQQPDIHYDGPLTTEYTDRLGEALVACIKKLPEKLAYKDKGQEFAWQICRQNWEEQLGYSVRRLAQVHTNMVGGLPVTDDDRKVVDICLCMERDFNLAVEKNFENPEYDN
jgi:hypothetical protein